MSIFQYYFNKCDPQFHHSLHVVQSTAAIVEFINQNSNAFKYFSGQIYCTTPCFASYRQLPTVYMRIRSRAYKMQATNGHVLFQITPATDLTFPCGFQRELRNSF
jgi:hypothetical protein